MSKILLVFLFIAGSCSSTAYSIPDWLKNFSFLNNNSTTSNITDVPQNSTSFWKIPEWLTHFIPDGYDYLTEEMKEWLKHFHLPDNYDTVIPDWLKNLHLPKIPWKVGQCRYTYTEGFEPKRFFNGTWYIRQSLLNTVLQNGTICSSIACNTTEDQANVLAFTFQPESNKYIYLKGVVNLTEVEVSSFNAKFELFGGYFSPNIPFTVLGTDYDNYAVIYFCEEAFGLISEMAWIVMRKPGDKPKEKEIMKVLELGGFNWTDFINQEFGECPPGLPKL